MGQCSDGQDCQGSMALDNSEGTGLRISPPKLTVPVLLLTLCCFPKHSCSATSQQCKRRGRILVPSQAWPQREQVQGWWAVSGNVVQICLPAVHPGRASVGCVCAVQLSADSSLCHQEFLKHGAGF